MSDAPTMMRLDVVMAKWRPGSYPPPWTWDDEWRDIAGDRDPAVMTGPAAKGDRWVPPWLRPDPTAAMPTDVPGAGVASLAVPVRLVPRRLGAAQEEPAPRRRVGGTAPAAAQSPSDRAHDRRHNMNDETPDLVAVGQHECCGATWGITGHPVMTATVPCPHCGATAEIIPTRELGDTPGDQP